MNVIRALFGQKNNNMETKKLRQKILDLAIHGKLVPQDPNDEPASILLERIRVEKERLIKEGKIKRTKKAASDTPHYENKTPFEVPEGWEWVRLEDYLLLLSGQDYPPQKYNSDHRGIPYIIGASNIENEQLSINRWTDEPSVISTLNDVLVVCKGAGVGKIAMNNVGDVHIARQIQAIRDETGIINSKFIKLCIASNISEIIANANGLIPGLKRELLLSLIIPVAPIEEQERIVNAVEQWFTLVDTLEKETDDLSARIRQTKSKILDLAIHGKLVPQDPNDEPAIELLKRINPKFTPCDNAHYENVPEGWTVCALEDIIDYEQPQAYIVQSTDYKSQYKTPVLTAGKSFIIGYTNELEGVFTDLPVIIFDDFTTDSKFVDFPFKVKSSAMKILHVKEEVNIQYVCWFMSITRLIGDTHKRYWISEYSKLHIPIPPRKEQDRIINKVNELFQIIDNISAEL